MTIHVLKLVSGDEVIGDVTIPNQDFQIGNLVLDYEQAKYGSSQYFLIRNPMKIIFEYTEEETRGPRVYLADWFMASSDRILPIMKTSILTMGTPNKDLQALYFKLLGEKQVPVYTEISEDEDIKGKVLVSGDQDDEDIEN